MFCFNLGSCFLSTFRFRHRKTREGERRGVSPLTSAVLSVPHTVPAPFRALPLSLLFLHRTSLLRGRGREGRGGLAGWLAVCSVRAK